MSIRNRKRFIEAISSSSAALVQSTNLQSCTSTLISKLLQDASIVETKTKAGWCLREGITHILTVNNGALATVVTTEGAPKMYDTAKCRHKDFTSYKPKNCFQSLCRIIAGQQLAGSAAETIWNRLLSTTKHNLTPEMILELAEKDIETNFQKPSGLSRAKALSIKALSESFNSEQMGTLTESFLTSASEAEVRNALLGIKGIGPWSCDMFLIFYLEQSDILPVGDLGVRNGIAKFFSLKGNGKNGSLCPKKDLKLMESVMEPYKPFRSLATYYMWKIADAKDMNIYREDSKTKKTETVSNNKETPMAQTKYRSKRVSKRVKKRN